MSNPNGCPICEDQFASINASSGRGHKVSCLICGDFEITTTLASMLWNGNDNYGPPHILSGAVRYRTDRGDDVLLNSQNITSLVDSVPVPTTLFEQVDLLVRFFGQITSSYGETTRIERTMRSVTFCRDENEFRGVQKASTDLGYLAHPHSGGHYLTLRGWERVEELKSGGLDSDQAFVAMWFDSSMDDAWTKGIQPALKAVGYSPMRIDQKQHNGKIDDHIIAEIRRSSLLVADFTGHRGGVYFEVGYAMGLSMPVIWTCRGDAIDKAHFDTRQYNHIVWSSPDQLRDDLIARIEATIPGRLRNPTATP